MRLFLIPLALLAASCSREPAPSHANSTSALPPGPDSSIAQAVPAGGAPPPAVVLPEKSDPGIPAAALAAPRNDPRWRDVDPSEIPGAPAEVLGGKEKNPELSRFEDEQSRRDAELMAQDSEEAQRQLAGGREAPRDERYAREERYQDDERVAGDDRDWRESERYRRYAEQRERYRGQAPRDGVQDPRRDPRYADENDYPPEELDPYAQPEPWDEMPEGPEAEDDNYDPESGDYYQR